MENNKPTAEQIEALRHFAAANGRYADYNGTERLDLLQQIRNGFGPSWLMRFSLKGVA